MNSPYSPDHWIGRLIGDGGQSPATGYRQRYRLEKCIGAGGMGYVFLAIDTLLGQQVALKLLKETLVAEENLKRRFEREVALSAALKSEHIVQVYDCGVTPEGHPFYVMEYLHGQTLGQLLRCEKKLSVEQTVGIISQVCEGLQLAHEGVTLWRNGASTIERVKVVHRDLKPDNIFLVAKDQGEWVKILDFGIAKILKDVSENTSLTSMFIGTFHYAAPEQLEVEKDLDERADIYSLGIILYEMLSGTDPFGLGFNLREISAMSWMVAHISKSPVPLRSQPGAGQIEPELEAVVMRCLQKAPNERFASVEELNRALQAAASVGRGASGTTNPQPLISEAQVPQGYEQKLQEDEQKITVNIHQQYLLNQNPRQNISPSIGVPWGREYKEKVQRLVLKATIVVAGAIASVSLFYYAHNQWQADQSAKAALESTKISKEQKKYEECVNQAKAVPQKSRFYADALNQLNECQRLVQDEKWLAQAKELAKKNNFKDAIAAANKILLDSSFHQETAQVISEWTERNNNEKYLKEAQNALEEGKWQEAINKANQVRLLGQEVKQDTPYWQNKMKPIIEEAQNLIAASNIQKSGTNNAAKRNPSPRIVRAQAPRRIVRAQAPRRIVRAQPQRRIVRAQAPRRIVRAQQQRRIVRVQAPRRIVRAQPQRQTGWTQKRL